MVRIILLKGQVIEKVAYKAGEVVVVDNNTAHSLIDRGDARLNNILARETKELISPESNDTGRVVRPRKTTYKTN